MLKTENVQTGVQALAARLPAGFRPDTILVLGTGLGGLAEELRDAVRVPYAEIPGYPASTVASHAGRFSFGFLRGRPVAVQEGRCHLYEGYSPEEVTRGLRMLTALGPRNLIITNAAGSLNPLFAAGSIMAISDHINFTGQSPLVGLPGHSEQTGLADNCSQTGLTNLNPAAEHSLQTRQADKSRPRDLTNSNAKSRFVDMSCVYDLDWLALASRKALELGLRLERGVYLGLLGPQLETRAETRMFRAFGADAIGMSTIMEVIMARYLGLRVLGLSALSNQNLPDCMVETGIDEVIDVAARTAQKLRALLMEIVAEM